MVKCLRAGKARTPLLHRRSCYSAVIVLDGERHLIKNSRVSEISSFSDMICLVLIFYSLIVKSNAILTSLKVQFH